MKIAKKTGMEHAKPLDTIKRSNLETVIIEEREEIQTKVIDNLFNNKLAENFPNIEKERDSQVQESFRTPNRQD
jgi:hypothetical protein